MKRKILLTIDDSPSPLMPHRLDFLRPLEIPIVWFCRGDNLQLRPEVGVQALRDGHVLGNHSWDHRSFSNASLHEAAQQIDRTEALLEEIHALAGVPRTTRCFRFPFEPSLGDPEHRAALAELLRSRGFESPGLDALDDPMVKVGDFESDRSWTWTYDLEDWSLRSSDAPDAASRLQKVLSRLDEEVPQLPRELEVLVGHDHAHTVGQWEAIILHLLDLECEFVSLPTARALSSKAVLA